MNEKQQLNEILNDIKNGIDRKNDLLMHEDIQYLIELISRNYSKKNNFDKEEIYQDCIIEFYDLLRTYTFFDDNEGNYSTSFYNYLIKYLPLRLNGHYGDYTLFRNKDGINIFSLNAYENYEFLGEQLQEKLHIKLEEVQINELKEHLTDQEFKILFYIINEYTDDEIADKICCTRQNVNYHRNKLMKKVLKFIC